MTAKSICNKKIGKNGEINFLGRPKIEISFTNN